MFREASTITDLHDTSDGAEVNLVSLVTEQLPQYQLRANSDLGYSQQDWLQTPLISPTSNVDLSPELFEETFNYFILSGDRLSQMTHTYHDIEAVTHLLEEKERDLELAARIGQTLLQKNRELEILKERLEEDLESALDEVSQLKHEIGRKEDLLHTYTNDDSDSSGAPSPVKELRKLGCGGIIGHIEDLQREIKRLESENVQLKLEKVQYENESQALESQEQLLVDDTLKQLQDLRDELNTTRVSSNLMTEELSMKNDEAARLQEEVTRLLSQIVEMQRKQKQLALENEELTQHLTAANNAQLELTKEIQSLENQYQEISNVLSETREEARLLRNGPQNAYSQSVPFSDSLAAELELGGFTMPGKSNAEIQELPFNMFPYTETKALIGDVRNETEMSSKKGTNKYHEGLDSHQSTLNQRAFDMARFVNNLHSTLTYSPNEAKTLRKQIRPIPTPLPLPQNYVSEGKNATDDTSTHGSFAASSPKHVLRPSKLDASGSTKSLNESSDLQYGSSSDLSNNFHSRNQCHSDRPMTLFGVRLQHSWQGNMDRQSRNGLARCITPSLGRPGIPGTEDLEKAIKKLALRRESLRYIEREKRLALSTLSSNISGSTSAGLNRLFSSLNQSLSSCDQSLKDTDRIPYTRAPKLRVVKPLEGSVTLNQWKYLAGRDRTLQLLVETRSGIMTRNKIVTSSSKLGKDHDEFERHKKSEIDTNQSLLIPTSTVMNMILQNTQRASKATTTLMVSVADECTNTISNPGKNFAVTSTLYTFTNCTVKNPDDDYTIVSSSSLQLSTRQGNTFLTESIDDRAQELCSKDPCVSHGLDNASLPKLKSSLQNKENTRTCSTELGLARLLKEHGINGMGAENDNFSPKEQASIDGDDDLDSPSTMNKEFFNEDPAKVLHRAAIGPLVWNRTLGRAFMLSANSNPAATSRRKGNSIKPVTPPNSPTDLPDVAFSLPDTSSLRSHDGLSTKDSSSMKNEATEFALETSSKRRGNHCLRLSLGLPLRIEQSSCPNFSSSVLESTDWSELHGSSGALNIAQEVANAKNEAASYSKDSSL